MKLVTTMIAAIIASTAQVAAASETQGAQVDSRVSAFCGTEHVNEIAGPNDVVANPDGYFVTSLNEQISLDDERIVFTNAEAPYLCTRQVATPNMDATNVIQKADQRMTSWLFVPFHPLSR